ncbi:MAG: hypothetical protein JKP90_10400 [Desulfofustis sp. PB-SRB1]|nr:hypothetical protein [Desulfofustis sp. PB-SRB1]
MVQEQAEQNNAPIDEIFFTRRMIREYTGWSDWQVRAHIKQLEEMEYIGVRTSSRGKEYSYILTYQGQGEEHQERCYLNLTSVEQITSVDEPVKMKRYPEGKYPDPEG